jgi:Tfp pilus assembly protein PilN
MIALNLLSPEQKAALRARVIYAMIERLMIAFVSSLLIASIVLLLIRIELIQDLSQVMTRQILSSEYVTVNNDIRQLNQQIGRIETLQRMAASPSELLRDVAARTPQGVRVTGMDFDVKSQSMRLNGIAATRDDLLAYEETMRSSPFVKSLQSPISNLFQKTDINFQFMIVLNVDAMKKVYETAP